MSERKCTQRQIRFFEEYLVREEKSAATVEKYLRDVRAFAACVGQTSIDKEIVMEYKKRLQRGGYAARSINSMLASVNRFLTFAGWPECRVKSIKVQKAVYAPEERELSKAEYQRLLKAAGEKAQLRLVMQTICSTGIRVSELQFFTVENVAAGEITVHCKGKTRVILMPSKLKKLLLAYAKQQNIRSGAIFRKRNGAPLDRKTIWARMKGLCQSAGIDPRKVFPHNLRRLFARTFYAVEKDVAKLADILGHSSIDTTRIYIMTTCNEHRRKIERLGLVV